MLYCSSFVVQRLCVIQIVRLKRTKLMYGCHCMNKYMHFLRYGSIAKVEQTFSKVTSMQIYEAVAIIYIIFTMYFDCRA